MVSSPISWALPPSIGQYDVHPPKYHFFEYFLDSRCFGGGVVCDCHLIRGEGECAVFPQGRRRSLARWSVASRYVAVNANLTWINARVTQKDDARMTRNNASSRSRPQAVVIIFSH